MAAIGIVRREKGSNGAVTVTRDHTHFFTLHSPATLAAACSFFSVVHFLANTPQENKVFSCVFFFGKFPFYPPYGSAILLVVKIKREVYQKKLKEKNTNLNLSFLFFLL